MLVLNVLLTLVFSVFLSSTNPENAINSCYKFNFYLSLSLEKDGFHRNLHYEIEYLSQLHDTLNGEQPNGWHVAVVHEMPGGLFVNPDEVNDLKTFKMVNASVLGYVNVEMQASYYTENIGGTIVMFATVENNKARMWCPVHARYHSPQPNGGFEMVKIVPGKLFTRSSSHSLKSCGKRVSLPCDPHSKLSCDWWEIPYILVILTDDLEWPIPIGNISHYPFVCGITLFITLAGCLYIASSVFSTAQKQHRDKKRKIS